MGRLRLYLITALAFLLEVLVLLWFPVAGVRPRVLPPAGVSGGGGAGPGPGGGMWIFGGILLLSGRRHPLADGPAGPIGGLSGVIFHKASSFLGKVAHLSGRAGGAGGPAGAGALPGRGLCIRGAAHCRAGAPPVCGLLPPGCAPDPAQRASPQEEEGLVSRPGKTLFYDRPLLDHRPGGRPLFGKEDHHAQPPPSRRRRFFLPLPSRPLLSCSGACKSPAARPTMPNPSEALPKWKPSPPPGASSWTATEPFWPRIR